MIKHSMFTNNASGADNQQGSPPSADPSTTVRRIQYLDMIQSELRRESETRAEMTWDSNPR